MDEKYWYLLVGVLIGWVIKVPFLIKWYKELKNTRDYQELKRLEHAEELERRMAAMYPDANLWRLTEDGANLINRKNELNK